MPESERRKHARTSVHISVTVQWDDQSSVGGDIWNISLGGVFIEMPAPFPKEFAPVLLEFTIPDPEETISCKGIVTRHGTSPEKKPGIGVEMALNKTQSEHLAQFLKAIPDEA